MQELKNVNLRIDAQSATYIKNEIVTVEFAIAAGELTSREGPNRYQPEDAIITGSTGDRWVVSRARFDAKYIALPQTVDGADGSYRNKPIPVLAKQIREPFSLARSQGGDILRGTVGDWVVQYGEGDYGVVEQQRFASVYARVNDR
jgi:hypothetical protein